MILRIINVYVKYDSVSALENVTFTVDEGKVTTLLGPNGSGKTSLLKCIDKLLKPYMGSVFIGDESLEKISRSQLARKVGYVPQIEDNRFPLTVFETVLLGRKPHMGWVPSKRDIEVVEKVLEDLGIRHLAHRRVDEISGGEWRKVVIARALAQEPKILLLDEPTNHLDLKHQIEVLSLIKFLTRKRKISVLMAMHDINLAMRFSDKMVVLKNGKVVFVGESRDIVRDLIEEVYGVKVEIIRDSRGTPLIIPLTMNHKIH